MATEATRKTSKLGGEVSQQFTLREQKAIVRYLFLQDLDVSEIHRLMTAVIVEGAPSYKEIKDWIQGYMEGSEQPDLCVCGGRASKNGPVSENPTDPALVRRVEVLILADKHITMDQLAALAMVSSYTIDMIITNILGLSRVCERWVPRFRTPDQRDYRMALCSELLELHQTEGDDFLSRVVVGDEAFVMYHASEQSVVQTKKTETSPGDKYKPPNELTRIYCAFFYDKRGMLYAGMQGNKPPTTEEYCALLKDEVLPAIKRKRGPEFMQEPIYLFTESTPTHDSFLTNETLQTLGLKRFPHAPASPDLEPHEFWFFKTIKRQFEGSSFQKRPDVWSAITRQLHGFSETDYSSSIMKLPDRWSRCIEKDGLYVL